MKRSRERTAEVEKLIQKNIEYTLDEIRDITYQEGKLVFDYENKHILDFDSVNISDQSALSSFSEGDCETFIEKFHKAREQYLKFIDE